MRNPDKLDTFPPEFFGLLKLVKKKLNDGKSEVVIFPRESKSDAQRKVFLFNKFRKSLQTYAPKSEFTEIVKAVVFYLRPYATGSQSMPSGVFSVCARNRMEELDFRSLYKNPEFDEIMQEIEIPKAEVGTEVQEKIRQASRRPAPSTQRAVDSILVFGVDDDGGDD